MAPLGFHVCSVGDVFTLGRGTLDTYLGTTTQ